jgi:hypothetical protein
MNHQQIDWIYEFFRRIPFYPGLSAEIPALSLSNQGKAIICG